MCAIKIRKLERTILFHAKFWLAMYTVPHIIEGKDRISGKRPILAPYEHNIKSKK